MRNIVPFKIFESFYYDDDDDDYYDDDYDDDDSGDFFTNKKYKLIHKESFKYKFSELSKEAQKDAIENIKDGMSKGRYGVDDIEKLAVDDDYLFEPPHEEMLEIFGPNYKSELKRKPLIGNIKELVYFDPKSDPGYFLYCKKALDISNNDMFLGWLGITPYFWDHISYYFNDEGTYTQIYFKYDEDKIKPHLLEDLEIELKKAESNFENHLSRVLDKITKSIESEYNDDDRIIARIESQKILFDEEGNTK